MPPKKEVLRRKETRNKANNINKEMFEKFCKAQATKAELREVFGKDALERFCIKEYGLTFDYVVEKLSNDGKMSLRRAQFKTATEKLNPIMLVWLGKQILGQSDDPQKNKLEEERTNTIKDVIDAIKNV